MKLLKLILFLGLLAYACDLPGQTFYVTKTGEKYHKSTCHYLKNSKKEITFEIANERGFTACSVCKPKADLKTLKHVENSQQIRIAPESTVPKATATQCTGKTKAGSSCKRMTKSANGRCYQH